MRAHSTSVAAAFLAAWLVSAASALAEPPSPRAAAACRSIADLPRLRADLERANDDVAQLKRADRSVRADYRLRERMADAEALAKKVTETEASLRALGCRDDEPTNARLPVAPPAVSPQDGSVELEAKAGLFADQAKKLDGEADRLAKAADELRSRRLLRRRAGAWERDPFSGLESSRRSVAASTAGTRSAASGPSGGTSTTTGTTGYVSPPTPTKGATSDSNGTQPGGVIAVPAVASSEAAAAAKTSPQAGGASPEHSTIDQRLYLDPTTAAELRQALGSSSASSDPEALDRAATALRARARALHGQAQALLQKSRAP